jgi:hypothetical protein
MFDVGWILPIYKIGLNIFKSELVVLVAALRWCFGLCRASSGGGVVEEAPTHHVL